MAAITDYMFDTSFINEVYEYLFEQHQVYAVVVDSNDHPVLPNTQTKQENTPSTQLFSFAQDMGGLLCAAENHKKIKSAEPHILLCLTAVNNLIMREQEVQETSTEMLELSKQLNFLFSLAQKISGVTQIDKFCDIILQTITDGVNADYAFLQLSEDLETSLDLATCRMDSRAAMEIIQKEYFQKNITGQTIVFSLQDGTSVMVSPILGYDKTIGHMAFFRDKDTRFFTAYEKKFVSIIDNIISPSLETFLLYNNLQELYLNTVKALAAAIDAKDAYTHGHSFRVAKFSLAIGDKLNLNGKALADLEVAAYMHDLGKIGVPEEILGKPGKLTYEEFEEVKRHPVLTNKILEPIKLPGFIVEGAVLHHERLDGSGYPYGMKGETIPLFARIIAVADVFDALTSSRPYRNAMTVEKALKIMNEEVPSHLDSDIVLALVSALQDDKAEKELREIYQSLSYVDIHNLNDFLVQLTGELVPNGLIVTPALCGQIEA